MAAVVLHSYDSVTGCLYFTISGAPTPVALTVQRSTDNGVTWLNDTGGTISPRCGYFPLVPTLFRLRLELDGTLSNILSSDSLPIRTVVNKVTFANSPIHLRLQNVAQNNTIQKATVRLWIWTGAQNKSLGLPNVTLKKNKVSANDNYINLEISEFIKAFLEKPLSNSNTNQPEFGYNVNDLPAVSGQGVFWQITAEIDGMPTQFETNFATLGWLWNYEQNGLSNNPIVQNGSLGFSQTIKKWYNPNVPKYFKQSFVLGQAVSIATSSNMILMEVDIKTFVRCTRESCLIVYINKLGLWDVFTPHGKITVTNQTESDSYARVFRDPSRVNNSVAHSMNRDNIKSMQSYSINTGEIDESNVQNVEELWYSPKVYLIRFKGDVITEITGGITIDNTFITVDDIDVTIDNTPTTPTQVPYFATFQQIPVVIPDSDFIRKTLINDKTKIDYVIKLDETNSKINSIK